MSTKPQISQLRLLILAPNAAGDKQASDRTLPPVSAAPLFSPFLHALTNSTPSEDLETFAGYTTHQPLSLKTKYYSADVLLWCDELLAVSENTTKQSSTDLSKWKEQMLSAQAAEVRDAIGGVVILIPFNAATDTPDMKASIERELQYVLAINELRDRIEDETGRDIAALAVIQDITPAATIERSSNPSHGQSIREFAQQFEDTCISDHGIFGWDIVPCYEETATTQGIDADLSAENAKTKAGSDRNEFGEKTGIARVVEVLEQIDWLGGTAGVSDQPTGYDLVSTDDFLEDDIDFSMPTLRPNINVNDRGAQGPISAQSNEFQSEIMELHSALRDQGHLRHHDADEEEDIQVEQLGDLMQRVVAIREAASEMFGTEREAFARREINKIMQEMNV